MLLSKEEMLECGRVIQEKKKEIEDLIESSKYLSNVVENLAKQKLEEKSHFNVKNEYFILGIGDMELTKLLEKHGKKISEETYEKIISAYKSFKEARQKLALSAFPRTRKFAWYYTQKYDSKFLEIDDFAQIACMALVESTMKYDYKKNTKFLTWVNKRVMRKIEIEYHNKERFIRIPDYNFPILNKIGQAYMEIINAGIIPTSELLSEKTGYDKDIIEDLITREKRICKKSFDVMSEKCRDHAKDCFSRECIKIEEDKKYNTYKELSKKELKENLKKIFSSTRLSKREKDVLRKRFGFEAKEYSLEELAKIYDFSVEGVRKIEKRALEKIRQDNRVGKVLEQIYLDLQ